jgi:serine/threonine-protein kinase
MSVWDVGVAAEPNHFERTVVERRDPLLGQVFDRRFRIEAKIAAGGFGSIYRVTHIRSGHVFALKVLHPNLTSDPRVVARFQREGAALTRLRDPHTITAYELGEAQDGTLYIVMELLRGESLYERFRAQGALPWRPVVALARAVCASLSEAHGLGIIHRDLKPTNIHLEPGDDGVEFVKVLDFGIAKVLQDGELDSSELTHAGQMIGTLDYMSPEQMVGGHCGPSSDLYTLGILMYEMIAGKKPFDDANSAAAALAAVLTMTPDRLSTRAIVPPDVDRIVMKCLERTHADRFQTAAELAAALDEVLGGAEDQVTTVAPSHRGLTRFAVSLPRNAPTKPGPAADAAVKPTAPVADEPALPVPNLDSTLVGHEPVARLPATPLRSHGTPHRGSPIVHAADAPDAAAPRRSRVKPTEPPGAHARDALPTEPVPPLPVLHTSLENTQDEQTQLKPADHALDHASDELASVTRREVTALRVSPPRGMPITPHRMSPPRGMPITPANRRSPPAGTPIIPTNRRSPARGMPIAAPNRMSPATGMPIAAHRMSPAAGIPLVGSHTAPHAAVPGTPAAPITNLREAYPMIHLPAPSPMRPQPSLDDRPAAANAPFDMARTVQRDALVRRLALVIGLAIVALVALWLARHM